MPKIIIANRDERQEVIKTELQIKFVCCKCQKLVEPDEVQIGRAHVYARHCYIMQEVGLVA